MAGDKIAGGRWRWPLAARPDTAGAMPDDGAKRIFALLAWRFSRMTRGMAALPESPRGRTPLRPLGLLALLALLAPLGGCAAPGDGALAGHPAATVAAAHALAGEAGAQWPAEGWWNAYGDPRLDGLIAEGLQGSPDMAIAAARLRRAQGVAGQAGAALWPSLDVAGQAGWEKQSYNIGYPPGFVDQMPHGWNDNGQLAGQFSYQVDLWGRNRAALAAAVSEARAAELDARQARLVLATGIASAYVELGRLGAQADILSQELALRREARELMLLRRTNGLETRAGLRLSDAGLANAEEAALAARQALEAGRLQLAALLGAGPDRAASLTPPTLGAPLDRPLPEGASTALLGRRPDIAVARERAMAATARVKVARADFYPALSLSALVGVQSLGLNELFAPGSVFGNAGPALSLPVFHGGALRARLRQADAGRDEAVASYDKTVVEAFRETAEAVTATHMLRQRLTALRAAETAAADAEDGAHVRFAGGLSNRLDLLQAVDRHLQARLAVASLEAAARQADIALVRALGGGFAPVSASLTKDQTHG